MDDIVSAQFVYLKAAVEDSTALFALVGSDLCTAGRVRESFSQALETREATYPTGLPVGDGVAIPHADACHVIHDTIAVVTLARPIKFQLMAGVDDGFVDVSTVFVLALKDPDQHLSLLPRVVKSIQDPQFLDSLRVAVDPLRAAELVERAFLDEDGSAG